ncbi:MAG: PRC-barrel domain-containing protein [Candidatus Hodarchaeales archaeon]|jgi:sporulation protein YlmC with PRC-barrel domain
MLKRLQITFFSYLKKFKVLDKDDKVLGHIGDLLLNKENINIHSLIIYGSFIEEKLEDIGLREDIDEIVPLNVFTQQNLTEKHLKIKKWKRDLKTTGKGWKVPENCYQFSKLKKIPVYNRSNEKIGKIVDIGFDNKGRYFIIVRGKFLAGIFADEDLFIPQINIKTFSEEKIVLNISEVAVANIEIKNNTKKGLNLEKARFIERDWVKKVYRKMFS